MNSKQKVRSEVKDNYKWDLTLIYKTDKEFLDELDICKKEINNINNFKGKIMESSKNLLSFLEENERIVRKLYKLYMYAHLHNDEDATNALYQDYFGQVTNVLSKYSELESFVTPEILKVDFELVQKYINEEEDLKIHEFNLKEIFRNKEHILNEGEETILSSLSKVCNSFNDIFDYLTDADMKFGNIIDEEGKLVELTESNYSLFIKSKNRSVRKEAYERLFNTYSSFKNVLSSIYLNNVESLTKIAKIRKFNSSIEASLFDDNVDVSIYTNLVNVINNRLDVFHKYYEMKKKYLKLNEMYMYDIYVNIVENFDKTYPFEEGKDLVIKALSVLGDDYVSKLNIAFDEKWIDVYNNVGKRSGAYSSGSYDTKKYMLLNYEGKYSDISTLAHELGHSMHSAYSHENQPYATANYTIFVAEVASTVNELLLSNYVLKNTDDLLEKRFILNNLMELFKGTIYRQVMFAEFEMDTHKAHEDGAVLTNEYLSETYKKLNSKYYGDNVVTDDYIKYEWSRIPHFYYNFYVYKYAVGLSCACHIVDGILNKTDGALENYITFLSSGGSDSPVNLLKNAGVDVTKTDFIESAINMFEDTINSFEEIS